MTCPNPSSCTCDCHNGYQRPCSIPGGCGLRTTTPRPERSTAGVRSIDIATLDDDVTQLTRRGGYLTRIRALLPDTGTSSTSERRGTTKVIGSPAPWNDEAASLLFEIHAGARRHDRTIRALVGFHPVRWGTTDTDTASALIAIPRLVQLALGMDQLPDARPLERAATDIARWPRLARRLLDDDPAADERPHTKAPGGLTCPYCERRLILKHGWQHQAEQDLWCLRCPSTIDDDTPRGEDLSWPAAAWLAVLQQQTDDGAAVTG